MRISEAADWHLFEVIARKLEHSLKGVWTQKADGLEERYWDLLVGDQTITLHLEHYLGISLFNTQQDQPTDLLEMAHRLLAADFPVAFEQDSL
nr:hypothetical protein [Pseudomonas folii]